MANVVNLSGRPVTVEDGGAIPIPEIVERLEELLAQAKRGDIRALAIAIVRQGNTTSTMFETGAEPLSHEMMAAICYLQHRYAAHKIASSEDAE